MALFCLSLSAMLFSAVHAVPGDLILSAADIAQGQANFEAVTATYANRSHLSTPSVAGSCSNDFRQKVPACQQYQHMWCWATCAAEVASFFKDVGVSGNDCTGIECKIVGQAMGKDCCSDKKTCGEQGGSGKDMVNAIQHLSGKSYIVRNGPLTQPELDTIMSTGYPIITGFFWHHQNLAHVTTLTGCSSDGKYFLHDSDNGDAGSYVAYAYHDVLYYATAPGVPDDWRGKWYLTVYPSGVLSEEDSVVAV